MFQSALQLEPDVLAGQAPGSALAAGLEQLDLEALDDAALVEVVAAWRRIESWAAARAARAAAALSERASMNPFWPSVAGEVREPCVAGEELALRLGCSRRAGRELVRAGRAFGGALWPTGDALETGEIDAGKARLMVTALLGVPGEVAIAVQEDVLPDAPRRTHAQLAGDVQRALISVDPDEAAERAARAADERRVCRPRVLPDGMAGIWAVLPAPAAVALSGELDAVARVVRGLGDSRTLDQLRADALCFAVTAHGWRPDDGGPAEAATDARADALRDVLAGPPLRAEVLVTVPLDALMGTGDGVAELAGYGAVSTATAEAVARGGSWRRLVTDPLSGTVLDVGRTRYRPPPGLDAHVRTRDGTCVRPGCPTSAWSCDLDHTVPFGQGPDGASGGLGASGGPGASGGSTSADNLGALCRRDHLLKTHGGFRLSQVAPGVFEWTTPTGHRYPERGVPALPKRGSASGAGDPSL